MRTDSILFVALHVLPAFSIQNRRLARRDLTVSSIPYTPTHFHYQPRSYGDAPSAAEAVTETTTVVSIVTVTADESTVLAQSSVSAADNSSPPFANSTTSTTGSCQTVAPPKPTDSGTTSACTKWYIVKSGDTCSKVADANGVDVAAFMKWNPAVGPKCLSLKLGLPYCVATCGGGSAGSSGSAAPAAPAGFNSTAAPATTAAPASSTLSSYVWSTKVSASKNGDGLALSIPDPFTALSGPFKKPTTTHPPPASGGSCTVPVPTPTNAKDAHIKDCAKWYTVKKGDTCDTVAKSNQIPLDTFMAWNPTVAPPGCGSLQAEYAYCVKRCDGATTASIFWPTASTSRIPLPTNSGADYKMFTGDGSVEAGWPSIDDWIPFDKMFELARYWMKVSCSNWLVPTNTDDEISILHDKIKEIAAVTGVDPRFILAIIMQESSGCVRVIMTSWGHYNPGLMQSYNGTGSCNTNLKPVVSKDTENIPGVLTPCPAEQIHQMVLDGTNGTATGPGMKQLVEMAKVGGKIDSQAYYRATRLYNGGYIHDSGDLGKGCCTLCYSSDIANRLVGWTMGSTCTLNM